MLASALGSEPVDDRPHLDGSVDPAQALVEPAHAAAAILSCVREYPTGVGRHTEGALEGGRNVVLHRVAIAVRVVLERMVDDPVHLVQYSGLHTIGEGESRLVDRALVLRSVPGLIVIGVALSVRVARFGNRRGLYA